MATKRICWKVRTSTGNDILHPETEWAVVTNKPSWASGTNPNIGVLDVKVNPGNSSGSILPVHQAMIDFARANRLAFFPPAQVTWERSTDGGETFKTFEWADNNTKLFFSQKDAVSIPLSEETTPVDINQNQLRVTIDAYKPSTTSSDRYFRWDTVSIYVSTSGVYRLEGKMEQATVGAPDTWTDIFDWTNLSGWSGPNNIVFKQTVFGGTSSSYCRKARFTFRAIGNDDTQKTKNPRVYSIFAYGNTAYSEPNNLAKFDRLYNYNADQDMILPAGLLIGNKKLTTPTTAGRIASEEWVTAQKFSKFSGNYNDLTNKPTTFTRSANGLVPHPTTTTTDKFLCENGTWAVPSPQIDTSNFVTLDSGQSITGPKTFIDFSLGVFDSQTKKETFYGTNIIRNTDISTGTDYTYSFPQKDGTFALLEDIENISGSNSIPELGSQYIRIWDLEPGIYKLTYAGTKYLYYMGSTSTTSHAVLGTSGNVILTVNSYTTSYKKWYYINSTAANASSTLVTGYTSSSTGAVNSYVLPSSGGTLAKTTDIPSDIPDEGITEITTQYTRIWSLNPGIYKLTYSGTKYLYYMGSSSTTTHTILGSSGEVILTINSYTGSYKKWYYLNNSSANAGATLVTGYTSSSTGSVNSYVLPSTGGTLAKTTDIPTVPDVSTWTREEKNSNYWKSTSSSGSVIKGIISVLYNKGLKIAHFMGTVLVTGTSSSDFSMIPFSRLQSIFPNMGTISSSGITSDMTIGSAFYYTNADKPHDTLTQQGGVAMATSSDIRFGRFYPGCTGVAGAWAFSNLNNVGVKFDCWLKLA